MWKGLAAADAYAQGTSCGIGGFIKEDESTIRWFSEQYSLQDFRDLEIPLRDDLQKSISGLETLAKVAILWIASNPNCIQAKDFPSLFRPFQIIQVQNLAAIESS